MSSHRAKARWSQPISSSNVTFVITCLQFTCRRLVLMVEADALGKTLDQREPGEQKMVKPTLSAFFAR